MSMFADYAMERENVFTIEEEYGFIQFGVRGTSAIITDVYVVPAYRRSVGFGPAHPFWKLGDKVVAQAKEMGCKYLGGRVQVNLPHASKILYCHLKYGLEVTEARDDEVITCKEI